VKRRWSAVTEAAKEGATAEEMEALLRLGRAYYVVGVDHRPAIAQSLEMLERARDLAVKLGDRRAEARALIPMHRFVDFNQDLWPLVAEGANRALATARDLGDPDLEIDALRAVSRMGTMADRTGNIERIADALERRGDLIALNEHLFDSMWTHWRTARFVDCVACSERATALATRFGIPPVQYGTIRSFALVDLGRFDAAWQSLEQEVADDEHPFGQAFQRMGQTFWYAAAGDFERVMREIPRIYAEARALQRTWMSPWTDNLLASAIMARHPEGTCDATPREAIEAVGGRLVDDALVAPLLLGSSAVVALDACAGRLPKLEAEG
jgi:hypothetical protein